MSLFFVHIPKAAGTSFWNFLLTEFPPHLRLLSSERYNLKPKTFKRFEHRPLIVGHTSRHFLAKNDIAQDHSFISVVREPTRRVISNLNYHLNFGGRARNIGNIAAQDILDNGIEWFLEQLPNANLRARGFARNVQWAYLLRPSSGAAETGAVQAIESLSTVGVTERLFDSILLTAYREELMAPLRMPDLNQASQADDRRLPDRLIEENLKFDYYIYNAGVERFERDYAAMLEDICALEGVAVGQIANADQNERNSFLAKAINKRNLALRLEGKFKHVIPAGDLVARTGVATFRTGWFGPIVDFRKGVGFWFPARDWVSSDQTANFWLRADADRRATVEVVSYVDDKPPELSVRVNGEAVPGSRNVPINLVAGINLVEVSVSGRGSHDVAKLRGRAVPYNLPNLVAAIRLG